MIRKVLTAAAALWFCLFASAAAEMRFEGRTFYFANRTRSTFDCFIFFDGVRQDYAYRFHPNDEQWFNLAPEIELTLQCPRVSGGARIENLSPLRRYLFLRREGQVTLFEVTTVRGR